MTEATKKKISESKKGKTPWNKGLKGAQVAWNKGVKGEDSHSYGSKNGMWKDNELSLSGVHKWVVSRLGKPNECENCTTTEANNYDWANLSGEYKRDISDWARLCRQCHRLYDDWSRKHWITRKAG